MPVRRVVADDRVADDRGKVALERGPDRVRASRAIDNGGTVLDLVVPDDGAVRPPSAAPALLGGVTVLTGTVTDGAGRERRMTAIPYYAWSHRGPGEMAVWLARGASKR